MREKKRKSFSQTKIGKVQNGQKLLGKKKILSYGQKVFEKKSLFQNGQCVRENEQSE